MSALLEQPGSDQVVTRQTRRAWLALVTGLVIFIGIAAIAVLLANFYFQHATRAETATLSIVSGSGALIRSPGDDDWRLITGSTTISEGDEVSTALGTVLWITLFDGSTVEVAEDTVLAIERMRSSRFLDSTKHVILRPSRGTVYVAMAPRGEFRHSEISIQTNLGEITMIDRDRSVDAGSFLVEVQPPQDAAPDDFNVQSIRAGVLRGVATLSTNQGSQQLHANEQVQVQPDGSMGPVTAAVRQLISDGSFEFGLASWVEFHDVGESTPAPRSAGSVELVNDWVNGDSVVAVEFLRGAGDPRPAQTGIRQRIGQTLRVYSSVRLEFDLRISAQEPPGGGPELDQWPCVIELNYIDILGEERQWVRRFYAIEDPNNPVSLEMGSRVNLDTWEHIIFDLRNLSPLPRQITSVVVYASGRSYQTVITNLSLTSSELGHSDL